MEQFKKLFASLSLGQKLSIACCAVAIAAGLFGFAHWRRESDFRPIYTGMAAEDAGAVVQKLKETGTEYRLGDNGATLLVPSAKLAELRLQLAAGGLPKSGRMGFEMFDKTNFGVTDFAEHVNYRRALEGELERSIISLAEVEHARVHLTFPKESVYLEARQPAKASVILGLRGGAQLLPAHVMAVCNMVASAVEGLVPEAVSVVDTRGNLLNRPRKSAGDDGLGVSEANLEYRQQVEKDLLAKIQSTLEPLLGPERFRAAVSAECDFSSGEQSEETFDPSRSVMVSSQKTEDLAPSSQSGGVPGTASNLPRPPARAASGSSGASRRSEEISYQSSRMLKRVRLPLGELKRVSVSLLLDQDVRWEGKAPNQKQVLIPPSPEKLKTIRDLVAGAISFKAERGDQLIVETLPFEATLHAEPPEVPSTNKTPAKPVSPVEKWMRDPKILIGAAGGVVLLLVLAFVGMRRGRRKTAEAVAEIGTELPAMKTVPAVTGGESSETNMQAQVAGQAERQARLDAEALESIKLPNSGAKKSEALTKYLRESSKKDSTSQVQTLRTWLHEKG